WVGAQRDVRVDERRAAEAAADDDVDVLSHAHVEERGRRADRLRREVDLHFFGALEECRRVLAGHALATALEDAYLLPRARQARRRDRAAVPGADDDDRIVRLQLLDRPRESMTR